MESKDVIVARLMEENRQLRETVMFLNSQIETLKEEIARLKKNSRNSSKPPSSDIVKPKTQRQSKRKRKRKIGGQEGHSKHERTPFPPEGIDEIVYYELSADESQGLIPLDEWFVLQQVELVDKPYVVTEYRARKYQDSRSGKIVITPLPAEIKAAGLVGPKLSALAAYQKGACHMSYTTIQKFWDTVLGIPISRSQLVNIIQKASDALAEPCQELLGALGQQPVLGVDESGHKDSGQKYWAWCFRAPTFTLFHIDSSRGSQVLKSILTDTFGGIIGSDYFSAYHKFKTDCDVLFQFCWSHLIREIRFLAEHTSASLQHWAKKLLDLVKKLFDTWHRSDQLTEAGFTRSMERIRKAFLKVVRRPPLRSEAKTLADRFRGKEAEDYFRFLTMPGVEPTNNLTEQAIRHIVIDRHITQGTRGEKGQRWCERAWTVMATCQQQTRNVFEFFCDAMKAYLRNEAAPSLL
jgi:transposase